MGNDNNLGDHPKMKMGTLEQDKSKIGENSGEWGSIFVDNNISEDFKSDENVSFGKKSRKSMDISDFKSIASTNSTNSTPIPKLLIDNNDKDVVMTSDPTINNVVGKNGKLPIFNLFDESSQGSQRSQSSDVNHQLNDKNTSNNQVHQETKSEESLSQYLHLHSQSQSQSQSQCTSESESNNSTRVLSATKNTTKTKRRLSNSSLNEICRIAFDKTEKNKLSAITNKENEQHNKNGTNKNKNKENSTIIDSESDENEDEDQDEDDEEEDFDIAMFSTNNKKEKKQSHVLISGQKRRKKRQSMSSRAVSHGTPTIAPNKVSCTNKSNSASNDNNGDIDSSPDEPRNNLHFKLVECLDDNNNNSNDNSKNDGKQSIDKTNKNKKMKMKNKNQEIMSNVKAKPREKSKEKLKTRPMTKTAATTIATDGKAKTQIFKKRKEMETRSKTAKTTTTTNGKTWNTRSKMGTKAKTSLKPKYQKKIKTKEKDKENDITMTNGANTAKTGKKNKTTRMSRISRTSILVPQPPSQTGKRKGVNRLKSNLKPSIPKNQSTLKFSPMIKCNLTDDLSKQSQNGSHIAGICKYVLSKMKSKYYSSYNFNVKNNSKNKKNDSHNKNNGNSEVEILLMLSKYLSSICKAELFLSKKEKYRLQEIDQLRKSLANSNDPYDLWSDEYKKIPQKTRKNKSKSKSKNKNKNKRGKQKQEKQLNDAKCLKQENKENKENDKETDVAREKTGKKKRYVAFVYFEKKRKRNRN